MKKPFCFYIRSGPTCLMTAQRNFLATGHSDYLALDGDRRFAAAELDRYTFSPFHNLDSAPDSNIQQRSLATRMGISLVV
jgi:hypothetical protein